MASYRYVLADVFTRAPLTGNPLAVFTDARGIGGETMQALARELNLSEIVFVLPPENGGTARIRIFNSHHEMPFAGHPTLGAAFVLAAPLQLGVIELETGAGTIPVVLERDESGRIVFGRMRQLVPTVTEVEEVDRVHAALGVDGSALPVELYDNGARHIVVVLESEDVVAGLTPDTPAIASLRVTGVNCVAGSGTAWKTRMFWPDGEDPATGSAAGPIACHLARHGLIDWGEEIVLTQGVELRRPSMLHARVEGGNGLIDSVEVGGAAVVVARGEFRL